MTQSEKTESGHGGLVGFGARQDFADGLMTE